MKSQILGMLAATIFFSSCSKNDDQTASLPQHQREEIPFTGTWQRQFEAGPGNLHTAKYLIYKDSIRYTLEGAIG